MRLCAIASCSLGALAACGSGSAASDSASNSVVSSSCSAIAAGYHAALLEAMQCDPASADPCGVQYPVVTSVCDANMNCSVEGLCWAAYVGYVNGARTEKLDEMLSRYRTAGCSIGYCPGPSPHETQCTQNPQGAFTCGGQ